MRSDRRRLRLQQRVATFDIVGKLAETDHGLDDTMIFQKRKSKFVSRRRILKILFRQARSTRPRSRSDGHDGPATGRIERIARATFHARKLDPREQQSQVRGVHLHLRRAGGHRGL